MTSVSQLADIESIKQLKAQYTRFIDTKNWDGLASLFSDSARFELGVDLESGKQFWSKAEYVKLFRDMLGQAITVHQAYLPEITITGPTTATGVWAMFDFLDFNGAPGPLPGGGRVVRGYGHYHEEYVKEDGQWRISAYRVTRLRLDESDVANSALS